MTVEDELRATFARHEAETPAAEQVRLKINTAFVRRKRRRAIGASAAAVLVLGIAVPVSLKTLGATSTAPPPPAAVAPKLSPAPVPARGLTVLIVGVDRAVDDRAAVAQTATLMRVSADRKHVYLVSIPSSGKDRSGDYQFRTAAQARIVAGALTGLSFDVTITVAPAAVGAVTDAVGGVPYCTATPKISCTQHSGEGVEALLRSVGNKIYVRDRTSQHLLVGLAYQLKGDKSLSRPAGLRHLMTVAEHSGLQVSGDLTALAGVVQSVDPDDIVGLAAPEAGPSDKVQTALYTALRNDDLDSWAARHPEYRIRH
jgi:hypothetical protein